MGKIKIIVAVSENNIIGNNNELPWYLPTDLKYFRKITENNIVIMGRKCWESIPEKFRPFKNRLNIVLSRDPLYKIDGGLVYSSIKSVISDYLNDTRDIFIIGGGQLYKEVFNIATDLYLTKIRSEVSGDIKLEGYNEDDWKLIEESDIIEENGFNFSFNKYKSLKNKSIAVIGSRTFNDYDLLKYTLDNLSNSCSYIVSGSAKGADTLVEKWADENNINKLIFKPDWKRYGKSAGPKRNKSIVENSDLIICFWDGKSKGTKSSIDLSYKLNKDILIINF